jgi:hypothetical protein
MFTIRTNGTTASFDARAAGDSSITTKLQSGYEEIKDEWWEENVIIKETFLLHSAHESRVAPRLRFLAGSRVGEGSRFLGDGEAMRRGWRRSKKAHGFIRE